MSLLPRIGLLGALFTLAGACGPIEVSNTSDTVDDAATVSIYAVPLPDAFLATLKAWGVGTSTYEEVTIDPSQQATVTLTPGEYRFELTYTNNVGDVVASTEIGSCLTRTKQYSLIAGNNQIDLWICTPTGGGSNPTNPALVEITPILDPGDTPSGTPGLEQGAKIRVAGSHVFRANPSTNGGTIEWTLSRGEANSLSSTPSGFSVTESAVGLEATFQLSEGSGQKIAVYRVRAKDNGFDETTDVYVVPSNTLLSFDFATPAAPTIKVYALIPSTLSRDSHLTMVFHGSSRNADDYCNRWSTYTDVGDAIIICPRFDKSNWSGSAKYNLGNVFTSVSSGGQTGSLRPASKWSFTVADNLQEWAFKQFALRDTLLDAWGHSAGGQFVHRWALFLPDIPVRYLMPANPGWWTVPESGVVFPYGLDNSDLNFSPSEIEDYTNKNFVIMRGELDNDPNGSGLRRNAIVDAQQGIHRFARAKYFFDTGCAINSQCRWELRDVANVGHEGDKMALAAIAFLTSADASLPFR